MDSSEITVDRLVTTFVKIRDKRSLLTKQYEAEDAQLKASMLQIEAELIRQAQEAGVSGFTIKGIGTTYTNEEVQFSIVSDPEFYDFVKETGDMEFLQRRVAVNHVKEWMKINGGELPPGLRKFSELRMRIRKSKADVI